MDCKVVTRETVTTAAGSPFDLQSSSCGMISLSGNEWGGRGGGVVGVRGDGEMGDSGETGRSGWRGRWGTGGGEEGTL